MNLRFFNNKVVRVDDFGNSSIGYSGLHQKNVAVIINIEEYSSTEEELLKKILAAVGLDVKKDILLIKITSQQPFSLIKIKEAYVIDQFLSFGISLKKGGMNVQYQKYSPFSFYGNTFLVSDPLTEIYNKPVLKKALWMALKTIYK